MKRPFQIGDRVRIYGQYIFCGTVTKVAGVYLEILDANVEYGGRLRAHYKQCRRLRPKEKSVMVTKKELAEAWDRFAESGEFYILSKESYRFDNICKELGL